VIFHKAEQRFTSFLEKKKTAARRSLLFLKDTKNASPAGFQPLVQNTANWKKLGGSAKRNNACTRFWKRKLQLIAEGRGPKPMNTCVEQTGFSCEFF
jgi:hypothetical protein